MKIWRRLVTGVALVSLLGVLSGCSKASKADTEAAIKKAIEDHLANRPGLSTADIVLEMQKVDVKGNDAKADVVFRSKKDPNASMNFSYQLHNDGSGWKVPATNMGAASQHSGMMPPPNPDETNSSLPAGHPPVGNSQGK